MLERVSDMCICFDTIPECDGQTDGRICHNNIALGISMLIRDKKEKNLRAIRDNYSGKKLIFSVGLLSTVD